jgi:hypothetical protein
MNLEKFLEDTHTVIADLEEARERLHAAHVTEDDVADGLRLHSTGLRGGTGATSQIHLAHLGSSIKSEADGVQIRFAVLLDPPYQDLLEDFANANAARRAKLADEQRVKLFSIVFALYRPGPAFCKGHTLEPDALRSKITPGGKTWKKVLKDLDPARPAETRGETLETLARECVRLDQENGGQVGSGFLLADGTLLTARHVILAPGWLFGKPPDSSSKPGRVRYNRVNGADLAEEAMISAIGHSAAEGDAPDIAVIRQSYDWREILAASAISPEFGSPAGLLLQTTPISKADLEGRPVAVIGHPLSGNVGGKPADIPIVFHDALLGTKRFMPGQIDDKDPAARRGWPDFPQS